MQRELNILLESDRSKRKSALERILAAISNGTVSPTDRHAVLKASLKCFEDKVERCRETALAIVSQYVERSAVEDGWVDTETLDWILPILVTRIGQPDVVEESEELRLQLLTCALDILKQFSHDIGSQGFVEYYTTMLAVCLKDAFPEMKKKACQGVRMLCDSVDHQRLKNLALPLAKVVKFQAMQHKHSAVRMEALDSFTSLMKAGAVEILGDTREEAQENRTTLHYLYIAATDQVEGVKLAFLKLASVCVLDIRDRLEQHKRFFPLLMLCCADPVSVAVRSKAREIMDYAGRIYVMDNEDNRHDLSKRRITTKDIEMYADDDDQYPLLAIRQLMKDDTIVRPLLGTRMVLADSVRNYIDGFLLTNMACVDPVRINHSIRCLLLSTFYAEGYMLEYLQKLVDAIYKVLADIREGTPEYEEVIPNIRIICQLFGIFLAPEHFVPILVPTNFSTLPLRHHQSVFIVMQEILQGNGRGKFKLTLEQAKNITRALSHETIVSSAVNASVPQTSICFVKLIQAVVNVFSSQGNILVVLPPEVAANPSIQTLDFALFWTYLQLLECPHNAVHPLVREGVQHLSAIITPDGSKDGIFELHTARCFVLKGPVLPNYALGELQQHITDGVVHYFVSVYLQSLHDIKYSVNATAQLQCFTYLQDLCHNTSIQFAPDHVRNLLRAVILPQCRFHPGGQALLFRRISTSCLSLLLRSGAVVSCLTDAAEGDALLLEKVVDMFDHSLDSDEAEIRLSGAVVISAVWNLRLYWSHPNSSTHAQNVTKSVFARLDDGNDVIRRIVLQQLNIVAGIVAEDVVAWDTCTTLTRHFVTPETFQQNVKALILHMDDMNPEIREAACSVLVGMKRVGQGQRDLVHKIAGESRGKQTFVSHIDQLIES
eukprot:PhF_6_TR985/c0_g1_i1/m.1922/K19759/DNAAF5; dynein assembly factor 5, axonemal